MVTLSSKLTRPSATLISIRPTSSPLWIDTVRASLAVLLSIMYLTGAEWEVNVVVANNTLNTSAILLGFKPNDIACIFIIIYVYRLVTICESINFNAFYYLLPGVRNDKRTFCCCGNRMANEKILII
ncbi:hypothetical protein [Citrobacter sp. RHB25-C09]|uniref:hypothetical protein n=1 Tax=Citrobacter sp. RHB25-C09 TaxID=2742624 RepID=UPI0020176C91|nr:hypothetical protein [Citrobacter sp. RHB25-C09]